MYNGWCNLIPYLTFKVKKKYYLLSYENGKISRTTNFIGKLL